MLSREIKIELPNPVNLEITKNTIREISKSSSNISDETDTFYNAHIADKYVISLFADEQLINSIACSGKIIVGIDFSNTQLPESYFCHCIFYNCNFTHADFTDSVINSCTFNKCDFKDADFTNSAMARNKIINCEAVNATFDYTAITDNVIIASNFSNASFIQSKIFYTGFTECDLQNNDFKDVDFVQIALTDVNLMGSTFKRSKMIDSILIKSNFLKCEFDSFTTNAITSTMCEYDPKYKYYFQPEKYLYTPSLFEWESNGDEEDDE